MTTHQKTTKSQVLINNFMGVENKIDIADRQKMYKNKHEKLEKFFLKRKALLVNNQLSTPVYTEYIYA